MKKILLVALAAMTVSMTGCDQVKTSVEEVGSIRPYIGDMLVVFLVYFLVRVFIPQRHHLMPLYVFIFACCIEGLQFLDIVTLLGLEQNRLIRVVVGTVFDWHDIICYGVGCVFLGIYEFFNWKRER